MYGICLNIRKKLALRDDKEIDILKVIKEVYAQQKEMFDNHKHSVANRIVNLNQPHIRPIVRGKVEYIDLCDRNAVEGKFGEDKRAYGFSRIFAKLKETSECVINVVFQC